MLKLENISKFYHEGNLVTLGLRKISLEFHQGEFVAITGESGSGKSTLLNVLSGIDSYEDGEFYVEGEETSGFDDQDWENYRRNYIGFIFQNYNLIDSYTVLENVEAAMVVQGISAKERRERAKEIIAKVGLTDHIKHKATKLSGGQKQRVAIARALAKNTKIIVADEPTGNLDSESGKQIIALLSEISKEKLVLLVTHNYEMVADYVSRKIKLADGEVVEDRILKPGLALQSQKYIEPKKDRKRWQKSLFFAAQNLKGQPKRSTMLTIVAFFATLFVASSVTSYYQIVNSIGSDLFSPNNSFYDNLYPERISIAKIDGTEITNADMNTIEDLANITHVYEYDYALDIPMNYTSPNGYDYYSGYPSEYHDGLILSGPKEAFVDNGIVLGGVYSQSQKNELIGTEIYLNSWRINLGGEGLLRKVVGFVDLQDQVRDVFYLSKNTMRDLQIYSKIQYFSNSFSVQDSFGQSVYLIPTYNASLTGVDIRISAPGLFDVAHVYFGGVEVTFERTITEYKTDMEISLDFYNAYIEEGRMQVGADLSNSDLLAFTMTQLYNRGFRVVSPYATSLNLNTLLYTVVAIFAFVSNFFTVLIVFLVSYLVIKAIFMNKKKDYTILRTIGLDIPTVKYMTMFELMIAYLFATALAIIALALAKNSSISVLLSFVRYLNVEIILGIFLVNAFLALLIANKFNKALQKTSLLTDLKAGE